MKGVAKAALFFIFTKFFHNKYEKYYKRSKK